MISPDTASLSAARKKPAIRLVWLLFLAGLTPASIPSAFAQGKPVFVTASFVDKNGFFIENLTRDEVQVFENDQARKLEFLAKDEIPAAYGLIFDRALFPEFPELGRVDASNLPSGDAARSISYALIDKLLGRQTTFVAAYDLGYKVAMDFSIDAYGAKNAIQLISGTKKAQDSFLYQAMLSAIEAMNQRPERRRILILFVDSVDMNSGGKTKQLKNFLDASNVELFTISFGSKTGTPSGRLQSVMSESVLKDLVKDTAGEFYTMILYRDHPEDLVRRLANIFHTYYTVGFSSTSTPDRPGKLSIRCTRPGSKVKHRLMVPVLG